VFNYHKEQMMVFIDHLMELGKELLGFVFQLFLFLF